MLALGAKFADPTTSCDTHVVPWRRAGLQPRKFDINTCLLVVCYLPLQPVPQGMSARIMREARAQQEELDAEEQQQQQHNAAAPALVSSADM